MCIPASNILFSFLPMLTIGVHAQLATDPSSNANKWDEMLVEYLAKQVDAVHPNRYDHD